MKGQRATCPADHRGQGPRAKVGPHAEVPDEAARLAQGQLPQRAHHHAARGGRRLHPDRAAAQAQGRLRRRRRPRASQEGQEAEEEGKRESRGQTEETARAGRSRARAGEAQAAAEPLLPVLPGPEDEGGGRVPPGAKRRAQQEGINQSSGRKVESVAN